jgi:hypothetical protein
MCAGMLGWLIGAEDEDEGVIGVEKEDAGIERFKIRGSDDFLYRFYLVGEILKRSYISKRSE